jgi:hypothetical protein
MKNQINDYKTNSKRITHRYPIFHIWPLWLWIEKSMDEQFEYLTLSPVHLGKLQDRLNSVVKLKEHIHSMMETFLIYSDAGTQLCSAMTNLAGSLESYSEFQNDSAIRGLSDLIRSFENVFNEHYRQIREEIVVRLQKFVKEDILVAEEEGLKATDSLNNYLRQLDAFGALNKKKLPHDVDERELHLCHAHWSAVLADFNFDRALSLVERKKLIEVTTTFLMFIQFAYVSYKQCNFQADIAHETMNQLQSSLPESNTTVSQFSSQTKILGRSLEQAHEAYSSRLHMQFPGSTARQHEGWLWKKGGGITKSWQRRFFVCRDSRLYYVHGAADQDRPQGVLDLLLTSVKPLNDPERRFCFTIISQQKTYTLQALTDWDVQEWSSVIRNNIQYLLDTSGAPAATLANEKCFDPRAVNTACADCGAPDPTWCCINWGVCICIRCSGVHREMTTSVSKVRSLTLDRLDNRLLGVISAIGNERANLVLQAEMPDGERIGPDADLQTRDAFLRKKYEQCAWASPAEGTLLAAVEEEDPIAVMRHICAGKKRGELENVLHAAAAFGDPTICLIVGLNCDKINELDSGGWSPLSYTAFHGRLEAAEALISIGCDPNAAPDAHPYAIASAGSDQNLKRLFLPYWKGGASAPAKQFEPPTAYVVGEEDDEPEMKMMSRFMTLNIIGKAMRRT